MGIGCIAEILDVVQDDICWFALELMILTASFWSHVGGNTGVYDDVLFTSVFGDWETPQDHKAMTLMKFFGYIP